MPDGSIRIHQRDYKTEAFAEPDGSLRVRGRLTDTRPQGLALFDGTPLVIHDMTIDLFIEPSSFEITAVEVDMHITPYEQCRAIVEAYEQLIGVSIARGYSRRIKELFGGADGCSHLGALLIAMGPVAVQGRWSLDALDDDIDTVDSYTDDDRDRHLRLSRNSCHMWGSGGAQITLLEQGDDPMQPTWHTARIDEVRSR